jgi:2,3-bisphosphoglycerate-independent phosphoglycerate mutase
VTDRAVLVVLDGVGLRDEARGNAVRAAETPALDAFSTYRSRSRLDVSGEAVGLPPGQMGNSEVGHVNLGAGRVVYQLLTRIHRAIEDGSFLENEVLVEAAEAAREGTGRLHVAGLVSDGGVHSHVRHLEALVELAARYDVPEVRVHAFTDGRDTAPTIGDEFLADVEETLEAIRSRSGTDARVATVSGRYYAMDRDEHWDRTERAYRAIVHGEGPEAEDAVAAVEASYEEGVGDEFVEPRVVEGVDGTVREGDVVVTFNFRPDRMRQIVRALAREGFDGFPTPKRPDVDLATMGRYREDFPYPVAFPPRDVEGTVGDAVAEAGGTQLRIAETEKYAHVTYFFGGGREEELPGEDRIIVPSPDVDTYDEVPEMSAPEVTDRVVEALEDEAYDLVVLNYANPDMVGHTGDMEAAAAAVEAVDRGLGRVLEAARGSYHVLVTADHGNAERMLDDAGEPHTSHTTQPTPLVYVGPREHDLRDGIPADVGPTLLDLMGVEAPEPMTGSTLLDEAEGQP